jgi:diguanylate cyclase (GGDEF)-like protein
MLMNSLTLLYVEDNEETQERTKMIIADDVKELYQAFDGEEGLEMYKILRPDVVLTDINMPKLDGLEMAKKIKEINKNQLIIAVSAFDDREMLLKAINIGIDFFLPKPLDIDELYAKLNLIAKDLYLKYEAQNSQREEMNELYRLAYYDSLTGIANRFFLDTKLEEVLQRAKLNSTSFAFFFIDLNNFKSINDNYGHSTGDLVLKEVAKNIKNVIRSGDIFARISGDEFAIVLEDIKDKENIDKIAQIILDVASLPIHYNDTTIKVSCSIGISIFPKDSQSKNKLFHLADMAMYEAKKLGGSKFLYA